jgi:predicted RND superfamily exporter protein
MDKISKLIVKARYFILVLAIILVIPSVIGISKTRINYDMLDYLPSNIETIKGQNTLMEEFGKGGFSMIVIEGMDTKDIVSLKQKIEKVDNVDSVIWYDSILDASVPMEILPDTITEKFNKDDATMMAVFYSTSLSADETLDAVETIRNMNETQVFVSGMSAMVLDLKILCEKQEPIFVALAVVLVMAVMILTLDNWAIPFVFIASIGLAIIYNLGTNVFLGEISFITKALAAVLQLAVTCDYSIFLWHSYEEQKQLYDDKEVAMQQAITQTWSSVTGSSVTTIAGFIALCFMTYTLGLDLGIVMAKGVVIGVIGCVTILPSLILVFNKLLVKFNHKSFIHGWKGLTNFILRFHKVIIVALIIALIPGYIGNKNKSVYYDLSSKLSVESGMKPEEVKFSVANNKLSEYFNVSTTEMILCNKDMSAKDAKAMIDEIETVDGVDYCLGYNSIVDGTIPDELIPDEIKSELKAGDDQLILINSSYKIGTDEANNQIDNINTIIKKYDKNASLIGEAPCTKDLIDITAHDFDVVNAVSSVAIFVIILIVTKSITLPCILLAIIQLAITINLGICYYTGDVISFIAPICITTIQLGATVDYAILMTDRYKKERISGKDKKEAISIALEAAVPSIIVSALGLFAATSGVYLYSDINIITSICALLARGAIISMIAVIFGLPSMFMLFDKIICKTTLGMRQIKGGE